MAMLQCGKLLKLFATAVVLLTACFAVGVQGQTLGASRQAFIASTQNDLEAVVVRNGGLLLDWQSETFIAGGQGATTRYSNFASMFSALGGSIVSSSKWIYNAQGVLTEIPANTPAQPSYTGGGALRGLAMEQRSTNVLLWSENYTQSNWTKTGLAVTANNRTAPTGTTIASTITEDSSSGRHWVRQTVTKAASALTYTASCHIARGAGNRSALLYVDDGAGNGAYAIFAPEEFDPAIPVGVGTAFGNLVTWTDPAGTVASGMVRVALTFTTNTATTINYACGMADGTLTSYQGDGTSSLAVWGMELKQNSLSAVQTETAPSSYIRTTTTSVVRVTDQLTFNLPTGVSGLNQYSAIVNVRLARAYNGLTNAFVSLSNSAETQRLVILQNSATSGSTFPLQVISDSGTTNITPAGPLNTYDQGFGIAARIKPSDYWIENTAQSIRTSTSLNYPSVPMTKIRLNSYSTGSTLSGNVGYTQVAIVSAALSNSELQGLLFPLPPYNPDAIIPPNYFTQAMINLVIPAGSKVFRSTSMPANDSVPNTSFVNYPLTTAYSQSISQANTSTAQLTEFSWLQWQNRCDLCRATVIGTSVGTNLTLTVTDGFVGLGSLVKGTNTPVGTVVVSQTSGTPGGSGVYVTNQPANVGVASSFVVGGPPNMKPNATAGSGFFNSQGYRVSPSFSSYANADAATYAQGLYANGYPAYASGPCPPGQTWCGYMDPLVAQGMQNNTVTYAEAVAHPDTYFPTLRVVAGVTYATSIDWVIFPNGVIGAGTSATYGGLCDCERADDTLASRTTEQMKQLALIYQNAAPGRKLAVVTNGLAGAGISGGYCGVGVTSQNCDIDTSTGNLTTIIGYLNHFLFAMGQPPPKGFTFDSFMAYHLVLFGPVDYSKIILQLQMGAWPGGTTTQNALSAHNFVVNYGMGGYSIAPVFAAMGGDQCRYTNLKIQLLLGLSTGSCTIP